MLPGIGFQWEKYILTLKTKQEKIIRQAHRQLWAKEKLLLHVKIFKLKIVGHFNPSLFFRKIFMKSKEIAQIAQNKRLFYVWLKLKRRYQVHHKVVK